MATTKPIFKGIRVQTEAQFNAEGGHSNGVLYLVRTSADSATPSEGFIFFDGKYYGTGAAAIAEIKALLGEKSSDYDTFAEWIQGVDNKITSEIQKLDVDEVTVGADKTLVSISETDGKITTSAVSIQIAESQVTNLVDDLKKAKTTVAQGTGNSHVTVSASTGGDGQNVYTINESDIASATALTAETSARTEADNAILAKTINGKALSGSPVLNGADIKLDGYEKADEATAIATGDTVNQALGKLEKGLEAAVAGGVTAVIAGDGIAVDSTDTNKPEVSIKINSADKVLTAGEEGLLSTITLTYDTSADTQGKKYIRLKGVNDEDIATIDASDFIKDGMLDSATYDSSTHTITLTWNTDAGKTATTIDVSDLVDTYTAGNGLQESDNEFSIKLDTANAHGLAVDASGLSLSLATQSAAGAMSSNDKAKLDATLESVTASGDTYVSATASNKADGTQAITVSATTSTVASLAKADSAVQSIVKGTDGDYVTTTVTAKDSNNAQTVAVAVATGSVADADNALAVASDVKTYVDAAVDGKNVDAEGDAYVSATAAANKVTVAATSALTEAVENANSAVQKVNNKTGNEVTLNGTDITIGSGVTYGGTTIAASGATVPAAIQEVVNQMVANEQTTASALTKLDERIDNLTTSDIAVSGVTEEDGETAATGTTTTVLNDIYTKLGGMQNSGITAITSNNITVTGSGNTRNIEVKKEEATDTTVAAGHIEVKENDNHELYAVMYYDNQDSNA